MAKDEVRNLVETLEDAGYETTMLAHGHGTCERCGNQTKELAFGACFVCAMWEDPSVDEREIKGGASAALELGITVDAWMAARRQWGKLVPPPKHEAKIRRVVGEYIDETVMPWVNGCR